MALSNKQIVLIICDGWGYRKETEHNAIAEAKKPYYDFLLDTYPHALLKASGEAVGLPAGEMGNSEVGHLTIGAGTPIDTDVVRIFRTIHEHQLGEIPAFKELFDHVKRNQSTLHVMGLVSPGGIHSHMEQLFAFLQTTKEAGIEKVVIHAFTDGRDTPPQIANTYLLELENKIKEIGIGFIGTVSGRYYAMDRDKNWERTQKAFDAIFYGKGQVYQGKKANEVVKELYKQDVGDEFIQPFVLLNSEGKPETIQKNDGVFFFNFRADRARQMTKLILDKKGEMNLCFVTMTEYDKNLHPLVAFPPVFPKTTLAEQIANAGLTQVHIAETEKYAHVTYFLNGGNEKEHRNEEFVLIPSRKDIPTFDLAPAMRAQEVADKAVEYINKDVDFLAINFANADMVGHSGNEEATIQAIEAVDTALKTVIEAVLQKGGYAFMTGDHGNAELNVDPQTGIKHTAHTTNPVPGILTEKGVKLHDGELADVAPTILDLFGLPKPPEMTGNSLIEQL